MLAKLHSGYSTQWASLCASFAPLSQKLREWQHLSAYVWNTPRIRDIILTCFVDIFAIKIIYISSSKWRTLTCMV